MCARSKAKIAIIEDDDAIRDLYRLKFELEGFEVKTAQDGQLGLELISVFAPDIVLLDLLMPNMDGVEMLRRLRKTNGGDKVKVVVLSNIHDATTTNEVYKYSPEEYLIKAILTPQQIYEHIINILQLPG